MKKTIWFLLPLMIACNATPKKITVGRDVCAFCKMTVSDNRFGSEFISKKGKSYVFDDIACLLSYVKEHEDLNTQIKDVYLVNFLNDHNLINANKAFIVKSKNHRGPMEGAIIAFDNKDSSIQYIQSSGGDPLIWEKVFQ